MSAWQFAQTGIASRSCMPFHPVLKELPATDFTETLCRPKALKPSNVCGAQDMHRPISESTARNYRTTRFTDRYDFRLSLSPHTSLPHLKCRFHYTVLERLLSRARGQKKCLHCRGRRGIIPAIPGTVPVAFLFRNGSLSEFVRFVRCTLPESETRETSAVLRVEKKGLFHKPLVISGACYTERSHAEEWQPNFMSAT